MAPEAFDGKRNEQTDIWSAGVIFYQMVSGTLPFPQGDITSLMGAILTRNPDPLPLSVPKPFQSIIDRALQKDITQRYRSASDIRSDLRRVMESLHSRPYQIESDRYADSKGKAPTLLAGANPIHEVYPVGLTAAAAKPAMITQSPESKVQAVIPRSVYVVFTLLALAIIFGGVVVLLKSGGANQTTEKATQTIPTNKEPQYNSPTLPPPNPSPPTSNTRGLKRYTGSVGAESAVFNLVWNSDNTISGNYYIMSNPNVIYSILGMNYQQGLSELNVYEGSVNSGIMKLYKTIEGNSLCWQGTFNSSSFGERTVRFCRNR